MKLQLHLYTKSMPDKLYASKTMDAERPMLGERWPLEGIELGALVRQVDHGYTAPIVVELYTEHPDSEVHRALDRESGWTRHGRDLD